MKKNIKDVLLVGLIVLIFILMLKIVFVGYYPYMLNYVNMFFWGMLLLIMYFVFGVPKDNNYLKNITIRYMIIYLLAYIIFIYLLGVFTGFTKTVFNFNLFSIFSSILPIVIYIVCREFVRYILCKRVYNNIFALVVITVLYIIFDIIMTINIYSFGNIEQLFVFVFLGLIPIVAKEIVCTYITYNISLIPTIIYVLAFEVTIYFLPIYPDLGNYINSILGLLFPFLLYSKFSSFIKYNEKKKMNYKKDIFNLILIPISIFSITIIVLVSGVFSYKMIAIGSDSMVPVYHRGDAVIYKKIEPNEVKKKDILVFRYNNVIVTHRVVNIKKKGNILYFQTKGDNNEEIDDFIVNESDVLGVVKYIVEYVGYPTVVLNELF